jgi:hypothetical protein
MNKITATITAALMVIASGSAAASNATYEYHADAAMRGASGISIENAYGYAYVVTDKKGHGVIRVMFSNGSPLHYARFNAHVAFLDVDGAVIREEHFDRQIEAGDVQGAAESRVSKLVNLTEFASVKVDFFLSDIPKPATSVTYEKVSYLGY